MSGLIVGLLALLGIATATLSVPIPTDFYAESLAQAHAEDLVTVGPKTYHVVDGRVYQDGAPVTGIAALPALKLAYEATLARRDPLLALPGTDPAALRSSAMALADIEARFAALQPNQASAKLALRLYPISFLQSAADLEAARQAFIAAPTPERARAYRSLLPQVMRAKAEALRDFAQAFAAATATSSEHVALFSGEVSSTTILQSLTTLESELPYEEAAVYARVRCSAGMTRDCGPLPSAASISAVPTADTKPTVRDTEILGLWDAAYNGVPTTRVTTALSHSACLPQAGPVHVALSTRQTPQGPYSSMFYMDELYLYDLSTLKNSPYAAYMQQTRGMHYVFFNPLKFYLCPQVGIDYGTALAQARMSTFADQHHDDTHYTLDDQHQLDELTLMLRLKTAGLEDIVKDIAVVMDADTEEPLRSVINTSVSYQFLTHSAFPTFFRIGALASPPDIIFYTKDPVASAAAQARVTTYSSLRSRVSRDLIVRDLRSFLWAEDRLASTTPR